MTPLDYYFWGAVKDKCYADKPEAIDFLKDNIREAIREIQLHTSDKRRILFTFGFNRKLQSMYCVRFLNIALSAAKLMLFGHLEAAI